MISNLNLFEGFFMKNKWSLIGQTLWKKKIYKTSDFYDKFYEVANNMEGPLFPF
jgi:hypothetical protein